MDDSNRLHMSDLDDQKKNAYINKLYIRFNDLPYRQFYF